jgi:hypothetical protein
MLIFPALPAKVSALQPQRALKYEEDIDYAEQLELLENLCLEKLRPFGERGYNLRKQTWKAKLRQIAYWCVE